MLGNLIENAAKYGGGSVFVTVGAPGGHKRGFVEVMVEDDGPGIPEADRTRIFDRGVRLDSGKPGTGLGLAIVRDVAEIYGGSVGLEESEDLGGLLARLAGERGQPGATYARNTEEVDRRAVAAVMGAERALGREPQEMPHNNPGFDIRSLTDDGHYVFLEVKGRIEGAEDFTVTRNEVLYGKNAERYRLALVRVSQAGAGSDEVRYVADPFKGFDFGDFAADGVRGDWTEMWSKGSPPL